MNMFSFYVGEDERNRYYWTGKKFSENEEECMLYSTDESKEFVLNNYRNTPMYKKMIKAGATDEEIKVDI